MKRYTVIDILRGIAIINMIAYHTLWDLKHIFDVRMPWLFSDSVNVWQVAIRWVFIFLSGFCFFMCKNKLKRGVVILICSLIISVGTHIFTPVSTIKFGVLSLIGTAIIISIPLEKLMLKTPALLGLIACLALFTVTKTADFGYLNIFGFAHINIPDSFYLNDLTAFFGFSPSSFYSSDYVPLLPWLFSFWMGSFSYLIFKKYNLLDYLSVVSFKPLEFLSRHSLIIYMVHQPIIYGVLFVLFKFLA